MKFASVYLLLFLQVSSIFLGTSGASQRFCYGWECPEFQVLQSTDEFEVRRYSSANWASVKLTLDGPVDDSYLFAITEASTILKKYRSGENDAEVELNVTFPVRVLIAQRDKKVEYVVSYFLPSLAQQHPPAPLDPRVVIGQINSHAVAVRAFRHGATTWNQSTDLEFDRLRADLDAAGVRYLADQGIVFLYDRRAKHTEVAFLVMDPENHLPAPASAAVSLPQDKPDFCGEKDCPNFEVTRSTRTYDVRRYEKANWAVVNVTLEGSVGDNYHKAWKIATPLLWNYRNKGNSKEVKMAHTVPMLLGVDKRLGSDKELVSFLFAYFIPFEFQDDVPDPNDKRVSIVSLGPVSLGVRSFSGLILSWDKQIEPQLKKLREDLESHGEEYHSGVCAFAQYHIFKMKHRHNEVAMWLKEQGWSDPFSGVRVPPVSQVHPDFCGELDCPNFDVVRSTRTYDVRRYEKANWAVMNVTLKGDIEENYLKAWGIAAPVLLNYRKKGNMQKADMAHTVPMLTVVDKRHDFFSNDKVVSFLFAYFIPFQFQNDVPEPNDKRISILSLGPVNLGTRAFSGVVLSWDKQIAPQLDKLSEDLDSHGDKYHAGLSAFAQYDILKIKDRHNEVGLWLKEEEEEPLNGLNVPADIVEETNGHKDEGTAESVVEGDTQESSQSIVQFVPPAFCQEHDCPSFDVLRSGKTFEIRKYKTAKWLTYNITSHGSFVKGKAFKQALKTGMELILDYNDGHNEHGVKVPMTVPVRVFAHERFGEKHDHVQYIVAFYIPVKFQSKPPKPQDNRLNIQELPALAVAVRSFHDASQDWDRSLLPQIDRLAVDLSKAGERYKQDHVFVSYYDYPAPRLSSEEKVYSEVWLVVDE